MKRFGVGLEGCEMKRFGVGLEEYGFFLLVCVRFFVGFLGFVGVVLVFGIIRAAAGSLPAVPMWERLLPAWARRFFLWMAICS